MGTRQLAEKKDCFDFLYHLAGAARHERSQGRFVATYLSIVPVFLFVNPNLLIAVRLQTLHANSVRQYFGGCFCFVC